MTPETPGLPAWARGTLWDRLGFERLRQVAEHEAAHLVVREVMEYPPHGSRYEFAAIRTAPFYDNDATVGENLGMVRSRSEGWMPHTRLYVQTAIVSLAGPVQDWGLDDLDHYFDIERDDPDLVQAVEQIALAEGEPPNWWRITGGIDLDLWMYAQATRAILALPAVATAVQRVSDALAAKGLVTPDDVGHLIPESRDLWHAVEDILDEYALAAWGRREDRIDLDRRMAALVAQHTAAETADCGTGGGADGEPWVPDARKPVAQPGAIAWRLHDEEAP